LNGISNSGISPITLKPSGSTANPRAEDSTVTQTSHGVEVRLKGSGGPNSSDKAKTDESSESGGTGNSTLDTLQKAIEMAKRQLEQAQQQLSAVESQSEGDNKAANQAAREAAQANVAAASAALMTAYAAYTETLQKAGKSSGGVSTRA